MVGGPRLQGVGWLHSGQVAALTRRFSFHSESSILTTLFGLLFWPILYMDIPGAFETPYQLAPLDLGDDSFYRSRQADVEERLQRMTSTSAAIKMLRETDEVERERGTLAIGVNWTYERQDLEEIITVRIFSWLSLMRC
jgi:Fanconi-associated nuclease 1